MSEVPWKDKQSDTERRSASPLVELRNEVERLFDSYLREPLAAWGEGLRGEIWGPHVDLSEDDQQLTVRADLPGVAAEDVQLSVCGNTLLIAGEKKPLDDPPPEFLRRERRYGAFRRAIELPVPVDPDQVSARFDCGVLTVRLKKTAQAATRRIPVSGS